MKRSSSFSVSRRGVLAASTVGALGVAVVAVPMLAISASATPSSGSDDHKVTICHRDNDEKKPYVKETVDIASTGLLKSGHNGHTGDVFAPGMKADHDKWGDIIPPYTYKSFTFAGLNWDADGQAIYNAGCKVVVATPTQTTPSEDPSPQESSPATEPSAEESSPATDPSPVESSPATDPSAEESSPATDPSPVESSPATDPSPVESSPATDPSPEDSSNGGPQGSGSPSPEESSSTPVDPSTPSDTTTDPGLPSTGGNGTTLPKTGSDTAALLGLAAGLVTMGAASIVVARRRTEVETD